MFPAPVNADPETSIVTSSSAADTNVVFVTVMPALLKVTTAPLWKCAPAMTMSPPVDPCPRLFGVALETDGFTNVTVKQPEHTPDPSGFVTRTSQGPVAAPARSKVPCACTALSLATEVPTMSA